MTDIDHIIARIGALQSVEDACRAEKVLPGHFYLHLIDQRYARAFRAAKQLAETVREIRRAR